MRHFHLLVKSHMKSFVQIVLLTAVSAQSISQSIPDIQFEWIRNNDCLPKGICMNIYLKAESNPSLTKLSAKGFVEYLYYTIQELKFDKSENGHIKLKLIFLINEPVCLMKLGYKGIKIGGVPISLIPCHVFRSKPCHFPWS